MVSVRLLVVGLMLVVMAAYTSAEKQAVAEVVAEEAELAIAEVAEPAVKGAALCPVFTYDAEYDFRRNYAKFNPYVTVVDGFRGTGCNTRGTLKITLASAAESKTRRRVLVDLFFYNPTNWVFNLGDSSSNNGWAGDSGDQSNDAELHGYGTGFSGYKNDYGHSGQTFNIPNLYSTRLSLIAGDGHVVFLSDKHNLWNYYNSQYLFALNGQLDAEGPINYDLYLGINKVIYKNSDRVGSGLCRVGIKFLPEY